MTTRQNEVECIRRLITVGLMVEEWLDFLIEDKLLAKEDIAAFRLENDKALWIHTLLNKAKKDERVLLLDFEWSLLPIERIKVTLVTQRNTKEFTYNAR
jgi:hypothetical protein